MRGTMYAIRVASLLVALLATLSWSTSVQAQEVKGKFVLPFDVQWQGATLSPGEYHFTLSSSSPGGVLFICDVGGRGKMMVVTKARDKFSGQSALTIVKRGHKRYVSSLGLESIGATLLYYPPNEKRAAERELEASVQIIPVQIVGS